MKPNEYHSIARGIQASLIVAKKVKDSIIESSRILALEESPTSALDSIQIKHSSTDVKYPLKHSRQLTSGILRSVREILTQLIPFKAAVSSPLESDEMSKISLIEAEKEVAQLEKHFYCHLGNCSRLWL